MIRKIASRLLVPGMGALCLIVLTSSLAVAQTTLTFWKAPHHPDEEGVWAPIFEEFERMHNVRIDFLVTPWSGWDENYTAAYAGGNPPDIAYMPDEFYPKFAEAGMLAALDRYVTPEFREGFFESNWNAGSFRGRQYGIPLLQVNRLHFYNADLLNDAGVAFPDTWEEMIEVAQALTNPRRQQFGYGFTANVEDPNNVYPFFWQAGADLLTDDMTRLGFDSPEGVQALEYIVDLVRKYNVTPAQGMADGSLISQLFVQGLVAMTMGEASSVTTFRQQYPDLNFHVAFNPRGPKDRSAFGNMGFLVISEASPNKDLAWKFIEYVTSAEVVARYLVQVSLFPARRDVNLYEEDPILSIFAMNGSNIVPYPIHPRLRQVHAEVIPAVQSAVLGQKSPSQALSEAGQRVAAILRE